MAHHLTTVARLAGHFADAFGERDLGFLMGLWHDLGKYNPDFQDYLWACHRAERQGTTKPRGRVPHAIWGAAYAYALLRSGGGWPLLALGIQGHHAGLPDKGEAEQKLTAFVMENADAIKATHAMLLAIVNESRIELPSPRFSPLSDDRRELLARMLLSALVDADRLATEEHGHPRESVLRGSLPNMAELWGTFEASRPSPNKQSAEVKRVREEVYEDCLKAAIAQPGLFRLTVPTGGGKTRSGLAFALKHAVTNGLDRVVVALPYTSIIDQTAKEYRAILGDEVVLEHHSALDLPDREEEDEGAVRQRLATENWDAPVVVTTTVQLFESLFTNRPTKARKLHRLAKSVIVLDEVQTLPPQLLEPTLDVLRWLATPIGQGGFGATVVLCTATQPAFEEGPLAAALQGVEIVDLVPRYRAHYAALRRVTYDPRPMPLSWAELAVEIRALPQALVVLNSRRDALALHEALGDESDAFHLSTLLCGAHRRDVLSAIGERLKNDAPVKLVSTQVVECGVDLDFPVVYRAIGPLDRIVQAAGRCNRHGKAARGRVVVFEPSEGGAPRGPYKVGLETARLLLKLKDPEELHDPELYRDYFRRVFRSVDVDEREIQAYRRVLNYPKVAELYRFIESDTVSVVVPYGGGWRERLADWQARPSRRAWRRLQPYVVGIYRHEVGKMGTWLEEIGEGLYRCGEGGYDAKRHRGLVGGLLDPSDLVVG